MGRFRILGTKGDTSLVWDPDDAESVAKAKRMFDELVGKGYLAFASLDQPVKEFDSSLKQIQLKENKIKVENSPLQCPYCHSILKLQNAWVACGGCLARHHPECWRELNRCANCQHRSYLEPPKPTPEPIKTFVPQATEIVMSAPLAGG